jgi:hypothetical protein
VGNLKEVDNLENLGVDSMILKWILKKLNARTYNEFVWFRTAASGGGEGAVVNGVMNLRVP